MSTQPQSFIPVEASKLLATATEYKDKGYRFVQCFAHVAGEGLELTYSFDQDYVLDNVRVTIAPGDEVQSITSVFPAAFIFENEMHDLFGVRVTGISVDFKGRFYTLREEAPMAAGASGTEEEGA